MNKRLVRIGEKIREARIQKNMTQSELSECLDVTPNTISNYENGIVEISVEKIKLLCHILDVRINDLLDDNKRSIQANDRLHNMMRDLLYLTNESSTKHFFKKYRIISREEMIVFPKEATEDLFNEIIVEKGEDFRMFLALYGIDKNTYEYSEISENDFNKNRLSLFMGDTILDHSLISFQRDSKLNNLMIQFCSFWGWIQQVLNHLVKDLNLNGMEILAHPITNQEYSTYKSLYPKSPGDFLHKILLERGLERMISAKMVEATDNPKQALEEYLDESANGINFYFENIERRQEDRPKVHFYIKK